MILATADKNKTVVLGDPKGKSTNNGKTQAPQHSKKEEPDYCTPCGTENSKTEDLGPLTEREIEEYSRIKCCVCGEQVAPEDITKHSRKCVLAAVPNLSLTLDKWCIVAANMTHAEQLAFVRMRREEELKRVEEIEQSIRGKPTPLWWVPGCFGYIMSSTWLREWRGFVGVGRQSAKTRDRPPGPINNNDLFELDGSLRVGLRQGIQYDYQVVEQPIFDFYMNVYGGGPTILRYNTTSGVLPSVSDTKISFEGEWRDRRPDTGHGRAFDPYNLFGFDGEIREGFLYNCHGKGLLRNGDHYEGEVVGGLPHGKDGREVTHDGTIIEGDFESGVLHGKGRITYPDGRCVEGDWEHGELCGI